MFRDAVTVQPQTATKNDIGQNVYAPSGTAASVPCNIYPADADYIFTLGLQESETRLIVCDSWPGDGHSLITIPGEDGVWLQAAPPKRFTKTWALQKTHVTVKKGAPSGGTAVQA